MLRKNQKGPHTQWGNYKIKTGRYTDKNVKNSSRLSRTLRIISTERTRDESWNKNVEGWAEEASGRKQQKKPLLNSLIICYLFTLHKI